jgi:hypothetical protein
MKYIHYHGGYTLVIANVTRYQPDKLHRDRHVIYRDRLFGTFAFARNTTHPLMQKQKSQMPSLLLNKFVSQRKIK